MKTALLLLLLSGCTIYDVLGWEGTVSLAAVVPTDVNDSIYLHVWATGENFAVGPGDSTCTAFQWKANRSAKFTIRTRWQPAYVLLWRSPTEHYPHLTIRMDGGFVNQDAGPERCR